MAARPPSPTPLKLLTWNIWMMPGWVHASPRNGPRAAAIAAEIGKLDHDILCFEKAFDTEARDVLWAALHGRYPYRFGPANSTGLSVKVNSGVWVLSRVPLTGYREIEFDKSAGVEVLSRKGAMMLSGEHGGHRFQLVATHLQGDDGPDFRPDRQRIREWQMNQIYVELVKPHQQAGVPLFVCGSFATPRYEEKQPGVETEGYRYLMATFGAENGAALRITSDDDVRRNDLAQGNTGRATEEDYILVRRNGCAVTTEWSRLILRHRGWDGPHGRQDLAYDYAVAAAVHLPG
jgi:endonuclease/exonuclease/phosphatase family metal-dependent hydrolase